MATKVILPKLGMNMESATIVRWYKREGDPVAAGDALAEIETDKTTTELEAETVGVLRKRLVDEGQRVAVNEALAVIGTADEDISALVAEVTAPPPADTSHVERVYQAWKAGQASTPGHPVPNGRSKELGHHAARPLPARRASRTGRAPGPDPEAIRARLGLTGMRGDAGTRGHGDTATRGHGDTASEIGSSLGAHASAPLPPNAQRPTPNAQRPTPNAAPAS